MRKCQNKRKWEGEGRESSANPQRETSWSETLQSILAHEPAPYQPTPPGKSRDWKKIHTEFRRSKHPSFQFSLYCFLFGFFLCVLFPLLLSLCTSRFDRFWTVKYENEDLIFRHEVMLPSTDIPSSTAHLTIFRFATDLVSNSERRSFKVRKRADSFHSTTFSSKSTNSRIITDTNPLQNISITIYPTMNSNKNSRRD